MRTAGMPHKGRKHDDGFDVRAYLKTPEVDRWRALLRVPGSWTRAYVWRVRGKIPPVMSVALAAESLVPDESWGAIDERLAKAWRWVGN
mgnify:CR=1 FL=1